MKFTLTWQKNHVRIKETTALHLFTDCSCRWVHFDLCYYRVFLSQSLPHGSDIQHFMKQKKTQSCICGIQKDVRGYPPTTALTTNNVNSQFKATEVLFSFSVFFALRFLWNFVKYSGRQSSKQSANYLDKTMLKVDGQMQHKNMFMPCVCGCMCIS